MAATASTTGNGYLVPSSSGHESEGFFSRLLKAIAGSREQRGRRVAYVHLARLSDHQLAALGHDQHKIAEIRKVADHGVVAF